jgi:hypothetical protein
MAEVGGVRSSVDPMLDLWFGENMGERRDATCSAARKISKGRGDGLLGGYKRPKPSWSCESRWRGSLGWRERSSESRMRENRLSGLMRGGKQTVPSRPLPAHSTEALREPRAV